MSDDTTYSELDNSEFTDLTGTKTVTDYTQVASVAKGGEYVHRAERRRQSLRNKLAREEYERDQDQLANSFITTFRNLFSSARH